MLGIDAHQHLWCFKPAEFPWLERDFAGLRRESPVADLLQATQDAGVESKVAVQARQSTDETCWLLQPIAKESLVKGRLPLRSPDSSAQLKRYQPQAAVEGLRHVVQPEGAGFRDNSAFNAGITALQGTGLVYDVLIYGRHLQEAIRFVGCHPQQQFDAGSSLEELYSRGRDAAWAERIRELAYLPHVVCKIAGMVTEADPTIWEPRAAQALPRGGAGGLFAGTAQGRQQLAADAGRGELPALVIHGQLMDCACSERAGGDPWRDGVQTYGFEMSGYEA